VRRKRLVIIPIVVVAMMIVFGWPKSPEVELPLPPVSVPVDELVDHGSDDHEFVFSSVPVEQQAAAVDSKLREECSHEPFDYIKYGEEREAHKREVEAQLSNSDDAEHLLAAAILLHSAALLSVSESESPEHLFQLLNKAAQIDPNNALVAWTRLQLCRKRKGVSCDLAKAEANARRVDSSNGAVWMEVAALRLSEGDESAAAEAVRRAIAVPRFDTYLIDYVILMERALSTHGESSYGDRATSGFGFSATIPIPSYITQHCAASGNADTHWIDLCDQLGAKMFSDSTSLADQAIGMSLQRIAAEQNGDAEEIARATAREAEFREEYQRFTISRESATLIAYDEAVHRRFVENFSIYGEFEAQRRLHAEVERLKNSPDYDQCNFVSGGFTD